jgi:hypothetical protein
MDLADLIELGRVVFGARADTKEKLLLDLANRFFISDFLGCLSSMQRSNIKLGAHRSKCAASHGGASVPATKRATSANVGADSPTAAGSSRWRAGRHPALRRHAGPACNGAPDD